MIPSQRQTALDRAARVRDHVQGEVFALPDSCVWLADGEWPLHTLSEETAEQEGHEGLLLVLEGVEFVAMLTQTCDLQRTTSTKIFCQVAPVSLAAPAFAREVKRGKRPGYVHLPWHDDNAIADLSKITTIERSLLADKHGMSAPKTFTESFFFAEAVSRHFTRAALPDDVVAVLTPFLERIKKRYERNSPEGRCLAQVANIRLEATPDLDAPQPDLTVLFILESTDLPSLPSGNHLHQARIDQLKRRSVADLATTVLSETQPVELRESWLALAELWMDPSVQLAASYSPSIGTVSAEVLNGEEFSFARSRTAAELDLNYLSNRAA